MNNEQQKKDSYNGFYGYKDAASKRKSYKKYEDSLNTDEAKKQERRMKQYKAYGLNYVRNDSTSEKDIEQFIQNIQDIKSERFH